MFLPEFSYMIKWRLALLFAIIFGTYTPIFAQAPEIVSKGDPGSATPVIYGIVVDNSGSYRRSLDRVINAVLEVIAAQKPDDEGFLVTFVDVDKTVLRQDFTNERSELSDAAEEMFIEGGRTAILDALMFSGKHLAENRKNDGGGRKALILISDGDDRESVAKVDEVIELLTKNGIRLYAIGIADGSASGKLLFKLAKASGGKAFMPKTVSTTKAAIDEIAVDMRLN